MTVAINQDALDYSNDAQIRVSADTRLLRKRGTISVVAGVQSYTVPDDVIEILAVYDGQTSIPPIIADDALELISADGATSTQGLVCYALETRKLGFLPTPTEDFTADILYIARTEALTSDDEFELEGSFETLIEHLTLSTRLDDDGQPELATYEYQFYLAEVARLRRQRLPQQRRRLGAMGVNRGQR